MLRADHRIHRKLAIEELEARIAPVMDITAGFGVGGAATFTGDAGNDPLVLSILGGNIAHNLFTLGRPGYNSDLDFDPLTPGDQTVAVGAANFTIDLAGGTNSVTVDAGLGTITWTNTGGTNTLIGPNAANAWAITGADAGTLNVNYTFSGVGNLTGGTGDDTFTIGSGATLSGAIDGGAGNDTLIQTDAANTWIITGANAGNVTDLPGGFTSIENLTGGTGNDSFTINSGATLSGDINGGGGSNTLSQADGANTWVINGADAGTVTDLGGTFSNIGSLYGGTGADSFTIASGATLSGNIDGGAGNDTLIQTDGANTWTVTGANAGTVTDVTGGFGAIENLIGGSGNDDFSIASGATLSGNIDGGGGTNTLSQADGANTWTITGANAGTVTDLGGTFSNIASLTGGTGADTFTIASGATLSGSIAGGAGNDTLIQTDGANAWGITGANAGTVTDVTGGFTAIENLTGGTGNDTFTFAAGGTLSGLIDGGLGSDTVSYAAVAGPLTITFGVNVTNIEALTLPAAANTVVGANIANTWAITGANTGTLNGTTFNNTANVTGGTDADSFTINSGATLSGAINGGAGTDTLIQTDGANAWGITGANSGTVTDVTGGFSNIENLTGGTGNDVFTFGAAGSLSGLIDGGAHATGDTVDYSALAGPITVTVGVSFINIETVTLPSAVNSTLVGSDIANAWVIDGSDTGTLNGMRFNNAYNLTGGTSTDTFTFTGAGAINNMVDGGLGTDTLVGFSGASNIFTILASDTGVLADGCNWQNVENLTGGANDDLFDFQAVGSLSGLIDGAGHTIEDMVDYSSVLAPVVGFFGTDMVNVEHVVGDGVNDTLGGDNIANYWDIINANYGVLNSTILFDGFVNLIGGSNDDYFYFNSSGGSLDGLIDGGAHVIGDTVDYYDIAGPITVTVGVDVVNIEALYGPFGAANTLVGDNIVNTWVIDGTNTGTLNGMRFEDFANLVGGSNVDTFTFTVAGLLTGYIDGGGGASDTIAGDDDGNIFTVTGADTGTLTNTLLTPRLTTWTRVENLTGGAADDTFKFGAVGALSGLINGLGHVVGDTVDYSAVSAAVTTTLDSGFINIEILIGDGINDTIVGANNPNTWVISGVNSGTINGTYTFSGFRNLRGGTDTDTFTYTNAGLLQGTLDGAGGANTIFGDDDGNAFGITGSNSGTLTGKTTGWSNISNLTGGAGADTFTFGNSGTLSGAVNGAGGTDTLVGDDDGNAFLITGADTGSLTTKTSTWSAIENLTGGAGADTFAFSNAGTLTGPINGAGGSDTLIGANAGNTFTVTGADSGTLAGRTSGWSAIENLTGGTGADTFTIGSGGTLSGSIDGGSGTDTLLQTDGSNTWNITGADTGNVTDVTGTFSSIENLTGGSGDDTFIFGNLGSLTGLIDGSSHSTWDTVDYSLVVAPVTVTPGVGFTNIERVIGDGANDTLAGTNIANTWNITGVNSGTLNGTLAFQGMANLTGGTLADNFIFANAGSLTGAINGGAGSNTITGDDDGNDFTVTGGNTGSLTGKTSGWNNIGNLTGGTGADTFTISNVGSLTGAVTGGAGSDTLIGDNDGNAFTITGVDLGGLSGKMSGWSQVENLTGGTGDDTFVFGASGSLSGMIDGDGHAVGDVVNYSAVIAPVLTVIEVNLRNVESVIGDGSTNDTFGGDNIVNTWNITGVGSGTLNGMIAFSGMGNLLGGSNTDTFTFANAGSLVGTVNAEAGTDTLIGDNDGNAFAVTGVGSGTLTGKTSGWSNFENLTGGTGDDTFTFMNAGSIAGAVDGAAGTDTLVGDNDGNAFVVTGADAGTLAGKTSGWSAIENLTGGTDTDTFTINSGATLTGNINGAAGTDTLIQTDGANAWLVTGANTGTVTDVGGTFSNMENLTGGSGNDDFTIGSGGTLGGSIDGGGGTNTLTQTDGVNAWALTGADMGTVADVGGTFANIASLIGGTGADTFTVGSGATLSGSINGGLGNDTLIQADGANAWVVTGADAGTVTDIGGGFTNMENLTGGTGADTFTINSGATLTGNINGGAGTDTLIQTDGVNAWVVTGANAGTVTDVGGTFSNMENLTGGTGADTFTINSGATLSGNIDGGAGTDTLIQADGANTWVVTGADTGTVTDVGGTFSNMENLTGGTGADTFTINSGATLTGNIDGGSAGNDTLIQTDGVNAWVVTGTDAGTVTDVGGTFSNINNLTGGTGADTFTINSGATLSGNINGGAGTDTLIQTDGVNAWVVTGADAGTVTDVGGTFSNMENLTGGTGDDTFTINSGATLSGNIDGGSAGNDTLIQTDGVNAWVVTGADAGTVTDVGGTFSNINNLTGGTGADTFTINSGATLSGNINGGAGTDTLIQTDGVNAWVLTGANTGTVTDVGGTFSNMENLTGGTGDDTFTIGSGATLTGNIDGGTGGNDTLIQTDGVNAWVVTGADAGTVTDVGGTFSNIHNLTGGTGADTFTINSGATLTGNIDGGAGADTLIQTDGVNAWVVTGADTGTVTDVGGTFSNMENLTGGTGDDTFTINSGATLTGNINGGAGADTLIQTDGTNAWTIDGANAGTVTDVGGTFSNMENLTGGTGDDTFTFGAVGSLSGIIDGGPHVGGDTVDYSAVVLPQVMRLGIDFTNIEFLIADGTNDTFVGRDLPNVWNITGVNSGTLTQGAIVIVFTGVPNLRGGSDTDNFIFANAGSLTGAIDGRAGNDTVTGDDDGNVFTVTGADAGTLTGKTTGWSNIENLVGGAGVDAFTINSGATLAGNIDGAGGVDTLIQTDGTNAWTIDGADTGTVTDVGGTFSNMENLTGGTGNDTFTFGAVGSLSGIIDGRAGSDTVDYSAVTAPMVVVVDTNFTNCELVIGDGVNDTLVGADVVNVWIINGVNSGTLNTTLAFTGVPNLTGGANTDTFTFTNAGSLDGALVGGAGNDTLIGDDDGNAFVITGADSGTLAGKTSGWSAVENLTGGAGVDTFALSGGTLTGAINGMGGSDTLTGDNVPNVWVITGLDSGTLTGIGGGFTSIQNIVGGMNTDDITLNDGGTITGTIDGGAGADSVTVHGSPLAENIIVDALGTRIRVRRTTGTPFVLNIGTVETLTVSGGAGNDMLTVNSLTGVADLVQLNLNGEAGDDRLTVTPSPTAAMLVDGGPDSDTFVYIGPGIAPPLPPNGVWTQAGFQDVTVINCEWVGSANKIAELANHQVIIYDTDATSPDSADVVTADVIIVLDSTGSVVRVYLVGNSTGFGMIVHPTGTNTVTILDRRNLSAGGAYNDISFIACMNTVQALVFKSGAIGYDVGTLLVSEGIGGSPDLDGDGTIGEATAVYSAGTLTSAILAGNVTGEIISSVPDVKGVGSKLLQIGGQLSSEVTIEGSLLRAVLGGTAMGAAIHVSGDLPYLTSTGVFADTTLDVTGAAGQLGFTGGLTNSTLNLTGGVKIFRSGNIATTAVNVTGNVGTSFTVTGGVGATSVIGVTGTVGAMQVTGLMDQTTVVIGGAVTRAQFLGGLTNSILNFNGNLGAFQSGAIGASTVLVAGSVGTNFVVQGDIAGTSVIGITGRLGTLQVTGNVDHTTVTVGGAVTRAQLGGNLTDSAFAFNNGLASFQSGGMTTSTVNVIGNVGTTFAVKGGMDATSLINVTGRLGALQVDGAVNQSTIVVGGAATRAQVTGGLTNSVVTLGGVGTFQCGAMTNAAVNVLGNVGPTFSVNGTMDAASILNVTGSVGTLLVRGAVDQSAVIVGGPLARAQFYGALTSSTLNFGGGIGSFLSGAMATVTLNVTGNVVSTFAVNGGIGATSVIGVTGRVGTLQLGGTVDQSTVAVGGAVTRALLPGGMTNSTLTLGSGVGSFLSGALNGAGVNVIGNVASNFGVTGAIGAGSVVTITGGLGMLQVRGAVDQSAITVGGALKSAQFFSSLTDSAVDLNNGVSTFQSGSLMGTAVNITGNVGRSFAVNGPIGDGSAIHATGSAREVKVTGGIDGNSTVSVDGEVTSALLYGATVESSVGPGSTVTFGSLKSSMQIRGKLLGTIDITGSAASARINLKGSITLGGRLLAGMFGDVTIVGSFLGEIGDAGTAAGVGNTLRISSTGGGGLVTPANAFAKYIGY